MDKDRNSESQIITYHTQAFTLPDEDVFLRSVQVLYREVERLRQTVQWQAEQLKAMAVELLLIGRWKPLEFVNELLGFQHTNYMVGCYDFVGTDSVDTAENPEMVELKCRIYELFEESFLPDFPSYCCETDVGLNTVLINVPEVHKSFVLEAEFLRHAERFIQLVEDTLQVQLKMVFSFCIDDLRRLPETQMEVQRLWQLQKASPYATRILYAGRLELGMQQMQEFSESQLQDYMAEQNIPAVHRCVTHMVMRHFGANHDVKKLSDYLSGELKKIHRQLEMTDYRMDILMETQGAMKNIDKLDEALIILNQYFSSVDLYLREATENRSKRTPGAACIHAYIDMHYTDVEFSFLHAAQELGMDENKISKIFKQQYGIGALSYLQSLRVQKAKTLLMNREVKIADVAAQSGFSCRRTMDRVFKRFTGITPGEYRNRHS